MHIPARRNEAIAADAPHLCRLCGEGPSGREGHAALRYEVLGPEAGQTLFCCRACGNRWTRRAEPPRKFAWTRRTLEPA